MDHAPERVPVRHVPLTGASTARSKQQQEPNHGSEQNSITYHFRNPPPQNRLRPSPCHVRPVRRTPAIPAFCLRLSVGLAGGQFASHGAGGDRFARIPARIVSAAADVQRPRCLWGARSRDRLALSRSFNQRAAAPDRRTHRRQRRLNRPATLTRGRVHADWKSQVRTVGRPPNDMT